VTITAGAYQFAAAGSSIRFAGFMALYMSVEESDTQERETQSAMLPELTEGQVLNLRRLVPKQHFTQPPPRFSEASLVKELEENGIGRPSTYAAILGTIREKGYVEMYKGYFRPTELGFIVNDLLVANFADIFGVDFTARMEDNLDRIEAAEIKALSVLNGFYDQFKEDLSRASEGMLSMRGIGMPVGRPCPECGKGQLHIKVGKNGPYMACDRYPKCRYSRNYVRDEKGRIQPVEPLEDATSEAVCEKCGRPMKIRDGRFGPFLACSGYPECRHTASLNGAGSVIATGVACPQPGCHGELVERKSKRGKVFYGCSRYPDCDYAMWDKPVPIPCPTCGAPFLVERTTKKEGRFLACLNRACGHRQAIDASGH
jgi:DNA topoisomerase-1